MRITRLRIGNVRRHRDLELRPAPGLTVIRGPNESGKSTIQLALELVLFRRATTTAVEFASVRTWGAESDPMVELDFELDGRAGRLVKRFAGPKGAVRLELEGVVDTDPAKVDHMLSAAIGIPSEKFFRSTASVRHFELEDLDRDERALRDRLQASIGGGDVGASTARRRLDEQIRRIRSAGAKNPGPLLRVTQDIARLTTELRTGEEALDRLTADRAALAAATEARSALDQEVHDATEALEAADAAVRLVADRHALAERYEHLRRATEVAERLAAAEAAPPTAVPVASLRAGVERLRASELGVARLTADRAAAEVVGLASPIPVPPPAAPATSGRGVQPATSVSWRLIALALGVLAVVALLAGAVSGVAVVLLGGLVLAGLSAAAAVQGVRRGRSQTVPADPMAVATAHPVGEPVAVDRDARLATLDAQLAAARGDAATTLAALGVPDLAAAESLLAAAERHATLEDGLRAELRGVLGTDERPDLASLRAARDEAAAKTAMGSHALDGLGVTGADPESARLRAQAALRSARHRQQRAIDEAGQAAGRVSRNTADADQVAARSEQLVARQEELQVVERRLRVYEQTLAAIIAAEAATMQKAARYLERRMGSDMARLTGGRYDRVRVDETDLSITVFSPERGDWVDATGLSKGTTDQLFLAARLGLVRQVTQERRPPLVFDDPFVTFDDERALRAVDLLRELADDHQVLYLTCSDRYDTAADAVFELAPPAGRNRDAAPMEPESEPTAAA